jgi:hypothetical protein
MLEGDVNMVANHAFEGEEVKAGYTLACRRYPVSAEKVMWNYDEACHSPRAGSVWWQKDIFDNPSLDPNC